MVCLQAPVVEEEPWFATSPDGVALDQARSPWRRWRRRWTGWWRRGAATRRERRENAFVGAAVLLLDGNGGSGSGRRDDGIETEDGQDNKIVRQSINVSPVVVRSGQRAADHQPHHYQQQAEGDATHRTRRSCLFAAKAIWQGTYLMILTDWLTDWQIK